MKNHQRLLKIQSKEKRAKKIYIYIYYGTEHKSTIPSDDKWVNGIHKCEFHLFFLYNLMVFANKIFISYV